MDTSPLATPQNAATDAQLYRTQLDGIRKILAEAHISKRNSSIIRGREAGEKLDTHVTCMLVLSEALEGSSATPDAQPEDFTGRPLCKATDTISLFLNAPSLDRLEIHAKRRGELLALLDHAAVLVDEACAKIESTGNKGLTQ